MKRPPAYYRFFGNKPHEQKRVMNALSKWWQKFTKKDDRYKDVPKWLAEETIAKAEAKRKMRAKKRLKYMRVG